MPTIFRHSFLTSHHLGSAGGYTSATSESLTSSKTQDTVKRRSNQFEQALLDRYVNRLFSALTQGQSRDCLVREQTTQCYNVHFYTIFSSPPRHGRCTREYTQPLRSSQTPSNAKPRKQTQQTPFRTSLLITLIRTRIQMPSLARHLAARCSSAAVWHLGSHRHAGR